MNLKKAISIFAVMVVCTAVTSCSSSENSSSSADTTTTTTVVETSAEDSAVGTTDYDVNGEFKAFNLLKENYADGCCMTFSSEVDGQKIDYTMCIKGDLVYIASVMSGMKSYRVAPGDGKIYVVSEATTTYTTQDITEDFTAQSDFLFGATGEFDKAEIDSDTNTVKEYYKLDANVTSQSGSLIYGFNGETYDITSLTISYDNSDPVEYTVTSIGKADESLLAVPDLSGYTDQTTAS